MKDHTPISMFSEFEVVRNHKVCNYKIRVPANKQLLSSRHNFIYKATVLWNSLINRVLLNNAPREDGMIVPGSCVNTDLSASISFAKYRVKALLRMIQSSGPRTTWEDSNFDPECNNSKLPIASN